MVAFDSDVSRARRTISVNTGTVAILSEPLRGGCRNEGKPRDFLKSKAHGLAGLHRFMDRRLRSALSRIPTGFARYLDARKLLRGSISKQSRRGLDWLNFFLADIQTGFGAFVAFYLAELGWQKGQVGLALAAGTVAALIAQIPGGALVDAAPWKRGLAAIGVCMTAASASILAVARLTCSYLSRRS